MSDELATPEAVRQLEEAIRTDLASATSLFVEGVRLLEGLEDALTLLPASKSRIKGWRNQVENVVTNIVEEQGDVSAKLLGTAPSPTISESVDVAHLEVVKAAKTDQEAA